MELAARITEVSSAVLIAVSRPGSPCGGNCLTGLLADGLGGAIGYCCFPGSGKSCPAPSSAQGDRRICQISWVIEAGGSPRATQEQLR